MSENPGKLYKLRHLWKNRYEDIFKGRMVAGEVMLSGIFSVLTNSDHINLSNFFAQLYQFYAVYVDPIIIGDKKISWKILDFGVNQVIVLYRKRSIATSKSVCCETMRRARMMGRVQHHTH